MSKIARVSLPNAVAYRGGQPMIAWLLHRISAIGIVVFVSMHIWAAFFLYAVAGTTGGVAEALTEFYEALPMQVFVLFCILYHAINGLRIVILDMWPSLYRYNREAMWVQWAIFLPLFLLPAALMILGGS
ncbi:MAG: Succinate dehydrogenase/Fumarate reductase transmembrane subunit [Chloroflexi bacterium ADurb.Bin325]|nr:MAG: Succinate dehydrogenase/Fumarate reductase transmembrane subunit [Chloroflexi bacterium ADurb.Bin325]